MPLRQDEVRVVGERKLNKTIKYLVILTLITEKKYALMIDQQTKLKRFISKQHGHHSVLQCYS